MANIDSVSSLDRSVRRHFKKVFNTMSDDFYFREPLLNEAKLAQVVIEGPNKSWLMLGQHLQQPTIDELERFVAFNVAMSIAGYRAVNYLAVVENKPSLFDNINDLPDNVVIIEQDSFYQTAANIIVDNLLETPIGQYNWIKKVLFPESVINAHCTIKQKKWVIDNTASLQPLFLDYDQERATRLDMVDVSDDSDMMTENLSVRLINGVAGSGKTLILINRAILFCKKYPKRKILLVIHNKPVTEDIQYKLNKWLGGKPENLTIKTFHAFALQQYKCLNRSVIPLFSDKDLIPYKEQVFNNSNESYRQLTLSNSQIWQEIEYINNYLIKDLDEYLNYERHGRGFILQKAQRNAIWNLYQLTTSLFNQSNKYLPSLYIRELALLPNVDSLNKYHHVLIDEAQFFEPSWLHLIRQSLYLKGSIFLCADPNQGFLKSRLSWKRVGFNVRGRTKKLNYSYRTTYQIMMAANALIEFMNEDSHDFVKPDFEKMEQGALPQVLYSTTKQDELQRFINELRICIESKSIPLHQIMVLCSDAYNPWNLASLIKRALGDVVVNCNDRNDMRLNLGAKIRLMTINSCTGMEAGITFILGTGYLLNIAKSLNLEEDERDLTYKESIRKLYVAMTRAGQKLILFSTEKMPVCVNSLVKTSGRHAY